MRSYIVPTVLTCTALMGFAVSAEAGPGAPATPSSTSSHAPHHKAAKHHKADHVKHGKATTTFTRHTLHRPTNTVIHGNKKATTFVSLTRSKVSHKKFLSKPHSPAFVKGPGKNGSTLLATNLYAKNHGHRFGRNIFYKGLGHRHWSGRHFHRRWHTWFWFDPCTQGWYYWYGPGGYYYPVTLISAYPPPAAFDGDDLALPPDADSLPQVDPDALPDVPPPDDE